jgi:hypothetical protein
VNLYWTYQQGEDAGAYVFAETTGKAKVAAIDGWPFCDAPDYTDMRAVLVKRDVGGISEACCEDCERLAELGLRYKTEEEIEAWEATR